jgi:hypothetical protein
MTTDDETAPPTTPPPIELVTLRGPRTGDPMFVNRYVLCVDFKVTVAIFQSLKIIVYTA